MTEAMLEGLVAWPEVPKCACFPSDACFDSVANYASKSSHAVTAVSDCRKHSNFGMKMSSAASSGPD